MFYFKPGLWRLIVVIGCATLIFTPMVAAGQNLPTKPDERFYYCLENLLNRYGNNPANWAKGRDKQVVAKYLKDVHGLELKDVVFGRNFLGLGVGNSPDYAKTMLKQGQRDAWGIPYDTIIASSAGEPGKIDILKGVFINQGLGLYNPELTEKNYVFLKADLHSQFGDVFKNFNGVSARIIAREVNFLGTPGSAAPDYAEQIKPALTAADSLRATIYTCSDDGVPLIMPKVIHELAEKMGIEMPQMGAQRRPMGPMKDVPVETISLENCSHELDDYKEGMRKKGSTMIKARRT